MECIYFNNSRVADNRFLFNQLNMHIDNRIVGEWSDLLCLQSSWVHQNRAWSSLKVHSTLALLAIWMDSNSASVLSGLIQ